jgi:RNA-binding protein Musashi
VFIGGIARETSTNGLRAYFERFGEISDCVVMKDRATGAPRGFGFVTFQSQHIADSVVLHRHVIDGKEVEAKLAVPRQTPSSSDSEAPPSQDGGAGAPLGSAHSAPSPGAGVGRLQGDSGSNKIFVGGLSHDTSEADFVGYFGAPSRCAESIRHVVSPPPSQWLRHPPRHSYSRLPSSSATLPLPIRAHFLFAHSLFAVASAPWQAPSGTLRTV